MATRKKKKTTRSDTRRRSQPRQSRHDNGRPVGRLRVDREHEHFDAGSSLFLENELEAMLSDIYREELPAIRIFDFIPVDTSIPAGAETVAYRMLTPFGAAIILREPSSDIPRVDLYSTKFTSPVYEGAVAYGFTLSELESAAFAGMPLERDKGFEARDAMLRLMSDIAINGGTAYGVPNLPGILSNVNIPSATVANPGSGTAWAVKTADQILTDLRDGVSTTVAATNGIEIPDTILLPIAQYELIAGLRVGDTGETVLSHFLRVNPHINRVDWLRELDAAGSGGEDLVLIYKNDRTKLRYLMPLPFQQRPAQEKNFEIVINCREKTGGVIIPKPLSLRVLDSI